MVFAWIVVIVVALVVLYLALAVKVVKQYEQASATTSQDHDA